MPANRKPKQERRAVAILRRGRTAAHAAREVGVHPTTVQRWAQKHEIELQYPFNPHVLRDDLVDTREIVRLRRKRRGDGRPLFTYPEIADLVGCSSSYVKQVCARARADGTLD